jgi:hypothetical protein
LRSPSKIAAARWYNRSLVSSSMKALLREVLAVATSLYFAG